MSDTFRLLFIGDVVGEGGVEAVRALSPRLREELSLDAVVANGENSAGGRGITREMARPLLEEVDLVTLGDHAYDEEEARELLEEEPRILRPANFAPESPGAGWGTFDAGGRRVGVAVLQGRVFMQEVPESPFEAADRVTEALGREGAGIVIIDFHAEATAEKEGLGYYLGDRAGAVIGTHTHVPTADEKLLPGGTAYISDVGMVGGSEGIIGIDRESFMGLLLYGDPPVGGPHAGPVELNAVLVEFDGSGRAVGIQRVRREL
ncbi:TIGR00282 family metallophosphoesterase [Rubrobacter aplysinae]|uniref:TIGR00282 family metallophosphoesterase n=1 Tax=Rubrobacter aplysinae TaxID=909625 RepID=UPI00064B871D|nr:TIGR00282 family metallophosphoesterase [Rubrobacter aplysinae]